MEFRVGNLTHGLSKAVVAVFPPTATADSATVRGVGSVEREVDGSGGTRLVGMLQVGNPLRFIMRERANPVHIRSGEAEPRTPPITSIMQSCRRTRIGDCGEAIPRKGWAEVVGCGFCRRQSVRRSSGDFVLLARELRRVRVGI